MTEAPKYWRPRREAMGIEAGSRMFERSGADRVLGNVVRKSLAKAFKRKGEYTTKDIDAFVATLGERMEQDMIAYVANLEQGSRKEKDMRALRRIEHAKQMLALDNEIAEKKEVLKKRRAEPSLADKRTRVAAAKAELFALTQKRAVDAELFVLSRGSKTLRHVRKTLDAIAALPAKDRALREFTRFELMRRRRTVKNLWPGGIPPVRTFDTKTREPIVRQEPSPHTPAQEPEPPPVVEVSPIEPAPDENTPTAELSPERLEAAASRLRSAIDNLMSGHAIDGSEYEDAYVAFDEAGAVSGDFAHVFLDAALKNGSARTGLSATSPQSRALLEDALTEQLERAIANNVSDAQIIKALPKYLEVITKNSHDLLTVQMAHIAKDRAEVMVSALGH